MIRHTAESAPNQRLSRVADYTDLPYNTAICDLRKALISTKSRYLSGVSKPFICKETIMFPYTDLHV